MSCGDMMRRLLTREVVELYVYRGRGYEAKIPYDSLDYDLYRKLLNARLAMIDLDGLLIQGKDNINKAVEMLRQMGYRVRFEAVRYKPIPKVKTCSSLQEAFKALRGGR